MKIERLNPFRPKPRQFELSIGSNIYLVQYDIFDSKRKPQKSYKKELCNFIERQPEDAHYMLFLGVSNHLTIENYVDNLFPESSETIVFQIKTLASKEKDSNIIGIFILNLSKQNVFEAAALIDKEYKRKGIMTNLMHQIIYNTKIFKKYPHSISFTFSAGNTDMLRLMRNIEEQSNFLGYTLIEIERDSQNIQYIFSF